MSTFTQNTVQASPYTVIRCTPVDVLIRWDGGEREVLHNVTLIWKSTDGSRNTYRTDAGNVRTSNSGGQRHNGHNYRGGYVEAVIDRETGTIGVTP